MKISYSLLRASTVALAASACLALASTADAGLLISVTTTPASGNPTATGSGSGNLATVGSDSATLSTFTGTDLSGLVNASANATVGNDSLQTLISLTRTSSTAETVTITVTETFATPLSGTLTANNTFSAGAAPGSTPNSVVSTINGGSALIQGAQSFSGSAPYSFSQVFTITFPAGAEGLQFALTGDTITLTGSGSVNPIPEPGSILVWSLMACAFGTQRLLRRNKRSGSEKS